MVLQGSDLICRRAIHVRTSVMNMPALICTDWGREFIQIEPPARGRHIPIRFRM